MKWDLIEYFRMQDCFFFKLLAYNNNKHKARNDSMNH